MALLSLRKNMEKKKIVVVDDDASIRKTFRLILGRDYTVYLARNAGEALERLREGKVDLVIADLRLPDRDGLEMVAMMRENGYRGEVILISAYPDLAVNRDLRPLGIGAFFVKPLDLEAINRSVAAFTETPH